MCEREGKGRYGKVRKGRFWEIENVNKQLISSFVGSGSIFSFQAFQGLQNT